MLAKPKSPIERISTALAWGMPDNESTGYTVPELLKLLAECRDELTGMRPPEAEPVPQHTHDEIAMPDNIAKITNLEALVTSTQQLLAVRTRELEESLRVRNQLRAENQMLEGKARHQELNGITRDEAKRRIEKIEKHLNALKETING